ncbi:MAG: arginine repressor [Clostridia bacterium]
MGRQTRQTKLLEIISEREIETQQELLESLFEAGFEVTQATVSRDIQDLGLKKSSVKGGRPHYIKPLDPKLSKLKTLFHQSVISLDGVGNMLVIKTMGGSANSACLLIDNMKHPEIVGTLAGEDTIFVVIRNPSEMKNIIHQFEMLVE